MAPNKTEGITSFGQYSASFLLNVHDDDDGIRESDAFLKKGVRVCLVVWLILLVLAHVLAPRETVDDDSHFANLLIAIVIFVTTMSKIIPLAVQEANIDTKQISGIMIVSGVTQSICLLSAIYMAYLPTPSVWTPADAITGQEQRIHLVRWAEWIALAFFTTFTTQALDLPNEPSQQRIWLHSTSLGMSGVFGFLLSYCTNAYAFALVAVLSLLCFSSTYIRLYQKQRMFASINKGTSVDELETYNRVRLSLRLLQTCTFLWTCLLISRVVYIMAPFHETTHDTCLRDPVMPIVVDTAFELISKVAYLRLYGEIHESVFDEAARAVRRLEELRNLMTVVWENSSDVICICVETSDDKIHAMVSPSFLKLDRNLHESGKHQIVDRESHTALLFEIEKSKETEEDGDEDKASRLPRVCSIGLFQPVRRRDLRIGNGISTSSKCDNVSSISSLLTKTSKCEEAESAFTHNLFEYDAEGEVRAVEFEARVTRMSSDSWVVILRDISERCKRFETEKQILAEEVERKKDAEANRFTRHEVKNGLLAAIGLVDSARHSLHQGRTERVPQAIPRSPSAASLVSESSNGNPFDTARSMIELNVTLHEVLNTILSEAMVRDVVHDAYASRRERVDVPELLSDTRGKQSKSDSRFPLVVEPKPFPQLVIDPQLLRYIHQGATSNAVKYGPLGGIVETSLFYNAESKEFEMTVTNAPGDLHDELMTLTTEEAATVFDSPGTRLHPASMAFMDSEVSQSAASGAWVMEKCAKILGGRCSISFEESRTVFKLHCNNIESVSGKDKPTKRRGNENFVFPDNTWGIAIDDSPIQRKIMNRFFSLAKIKSDKRIILGKDTEEILGFTTRALKLIRDENPSSNFLIIADENLDIVEGGAHQSTVSGSMLVKQLREELSQEDESRILALVRSANDSSDDIALYESRAHGFLAKAPMKKDQMLELIQPWWEMRFDSYKVASSDSSGEESSDVIPTREDMIRMIEIIHALCTQCDEVALPARWPAIREKIHALRGDLKTMKSGTQVASVLDSMSKLTGDELPVELIERWKLIRSAILSLI